MTISDKSFTPTHTIRVAERLLTAFLKVATKQYLSLKPTDLPTVPPPQPGHRYTLYAHVPFCESLCPYCSFNRFVLNREKASLVLSNPCARKCASWQDLGYRFTSLYLGGGTPTVLPDELVADHRPGA